MTKFKLEGVIGTIDRDGWIRWAGINCHIDGLADCGLKRAVLRALSKTN